MRLNAIRGQVRVAPVTEIPVAIPLTIFLTADLRSVGFTMRK